jgi:hypothetical protein
MEFVLLTQDDYNYFVKLKEQQQKRNEYHNQYNKNKIQDLKQTNHEEYKKKMTKQNEANKIYKQNLLNKLKQDTEAYKEYNIKLSKYRQAMRQAQRNLLKSYEVAT